MKIGETFIDTPPNDYIKLGHSSSKNMLLLEGIDVRTRVLNERLGLPRNKAVAWHIPAGFDPDGASMPQPLWWWISPTTWWILLAAIAHDYVWRYGFAHLYLIDLDTKLIEKDLGVKLLTYKEGTCIMREKMESFFGGWVSRNLVYLTLELVRIISRRK